MGRRAWTGQTSRTGGSLSFLPFLTTLYATGGPGRLSTSDTANPALDVAAKSPHPHTRATKQSEWRDEPPGCGSAPPGPVRGYALQALTDQDLLDGHDAPHARLSRELITRAGTVRTLACDIQRTLQDVRTRHQHCNVQPGANACWTLASEMDMILTALRETQSAAT